MTAPRPSPADRIRAPLVRASRVRGVVLRHRRLLAAVCAAVAVVAVLQVVEPPPPATESVVVAARDLPAGAILSARDVRTAAYAVGTAPDGLVADAVGRALTGPVRRGEPVTVTRVVEPGFLEAHPDLVAVPVRIPDSTTVSLLRVGDRVDLLATDPAAGRAERVASRALVLALPAEPETLSGGTTGRLVLFGLSEREASTVSVSAVRDVVTPMWSGSH